MPGSILGHPVQRTEDPRLVTGAAKYVDDLDVPGGLHAVFVRSPIAHARIEEVDLSEAASMPGVVAVWTAEELGAEPVSGSGIIPQPMWRPPLARETVRFVGDAVAVVLAETRAQAADAAEAVFVSYDPLDAVADAERALADDSPVIFPEHGSNVAFELPSSGEDVLEEAEVVVRGRFVNQRVAAIPLEGNAFAIAPDSESGGFTAWAATQNPHDIRDGLARLLELDEEKVRVIAPAVGGGFGAKAALYPEFVVCALAAKRLERPVRWAETRSENLMAMTHGRGQVQEVELGAKRTGEITGLRVRITQDAGAYPGMGALLPFMTRMVASGVYRIPRIDCSSRSVVTNTTPISAYRGAGRPEAAALTERAMDMLAAELGMDPSDVRRKNFIPPDAFPYTTPTGATYDTGEYAKALDTALAHAGYDDLRREQAERRERGDPVQLGVGISCFLEVSGVGVAGNKEYASVEIAEDGSVTVLSGSSAHGQGHETAFAQIAAELLGVEMSSVRVIQSDTAVVPRGSGTAGSRSLQLGGSAVFRAGEAVVEKARQVAAHLLEAAPEDIVVHPGGRVGVAGAPGRALGWDEVARAAADPGRLPEGMEPGLRAEVDFDQGATTFPFGAHVCVVEVDTETGHVKIRRYVSVDDCGTMVNPLLVAGQVHGGLAQGIAQALYESVDYDEDGNLLTGSLASYEIPSAAELPSYDVVPMETPTPLNPLGAKGIGELATVGSTPAVQNAVVDALSHLGVRHIDLPLSPERVWRAVQEARGS